MYRMLLQRPDVLIGRIVSTNRDVYTYQIVRKGLRDLAAGGTSVCPVSYTHLICSRDEAQKAVWARMVLGFQKVIFFGETKNSSQSLYEDKMKKLAAKIRQSFETLNVTEFRRCTEEFFTLPKHILGGAIALSLIHI